MKEFIKNMWDGEPVYLFGAINVTAAALATVYQYQWLSAVVLITVGLSAFVTRKQVSPSDD